MRSVPVVNNLHNEKRLERHTSDIRLHKRKQREEGKKTDRVEHKTKSPAQKEAKASELHPWRLELEIFPSWLPCGPCGPTDMNLLLRVSVTHRPALTNSILGRWKERSLRMNHPDESSILAYEPLQTIK